MLFLYKYRYVLLLSLAVFVLSFLVAYYNGFLYASESFKKKPNVAGTAVNGGETLAYFFGAKKLKILEEYQLCGHFKTLKEEKASFLSKADLEKQYPPEDGWSIKSDEHSVLIKKLVPGFCPVDAEKRHLGVLGRYVAVYLGPSGYGGDLAFVTSIRVDQLPFEWQVKLAEGLLEFPCEAKLLEALDSLEELQQAE